MRTHVMRFFSFVRTHGVIIAAIIFLLMVAGTLAFFFQNTNSLHQYQQEIQELSYTDREWTFQEYSDYFRVLAEKKGGAYAFEVLKRASFPPNVDLHLLGHVVGDVLYKQEGIEGMKVCTHELRNACSHSIVIGTLLEHGEGALSGIVNACKEAPGGRGAYTMCFHGLGHGVLAYTGYDFEKAALMCEKTGTPEYQGREAIECVGGMTMEMIAGVHDHDAWEKQKDTFLKPSDPLSPCNAPFLKEEFRPICYVYLTPYLFEAAGMDLGIPDPSTFKKAFSSCARIPKERVIERDACYGGFGKEFVVIVQGRDVRDVGSTQEPALRNIRQWCAEAGDSSGEQSCNSSALASLFWGGENNPEASFRFCSIAEGEAQSRCYQELGGHIGYYFQGDVRGKALCERLPTEYQVACTPR